MPHNKRRSFKFEKPLRSFLKTQRWLLWGCLATLAVIVGCASLTAGPQTPPLSLIQKTDWAHHASDLQISPDLVLGRLPNGFRYVLKQNQTPADRVSMHLFVQAGSLCEYEEEQGIAHFLEHMLFNGSTHFKPDELVKYFQRIGMRFGPDANAHTGFAETVYDVLLPKGDTQSMSEAMRVLRDYAQGALLLPEQIEKEKKVVLSEKRARDSAQYRTMQTAFAFEMPGALPARRFPIGRQETILAFDQTRLRQFYDAWYRPERMILIMVGQFDTDHARDLIETEFASMTPRAPERSLPAFGRFDHRGLNVFYHLEKETGSTSVRIETIAPHPQPTDSKTYQKQMLIDQVANRIVQNRLDKLLQNSQSGLTGADIGSAYFLQQIRYTEISAGCKAENWETALTAIERILRQALAHGFAAAELDRVKQSYLSELRRDVKEAPTRDSQMVAREIMQSLGTWRVMQSAGQRLKLLSPILESLTPREVHDAFVKNWSAPHRLVLVTGDADLTGQALSAEDRIEQAYLQSVGTTVAPPVEQIAAVFPYLPDPPAEAKILERVAIADLGIDTVVFANGVRLNMKQTDFKANEVLAALAFGHGKSGEPPDQAGLAELTETLLNEAGFGAMARTDLEQALAGRLTDITLDVREDRFVLNGESVTDELQLLFELMRTFVLDPGYRPEALQVVHKRLAQHYQALTFDVSGVMEMEGQRFLAGGDSRFGWPPREQFQNLTLEQVKAWLTPALRVPMELTVVGDFDPEKVVALAARYLGTLPIASNAPALDPRSAQPQFPRGQSLYRPVVTQIANTLVVVAYPTEDFWDIGRVRRLSILGEIFSERLRVGIREKLGAAYSPFAYNRSYRAYPGYGVFQAHLQVDPLMADAMVAQVKQIADGLREGGLSADEFRRALDPALTQIKDLRRKNSYWLNSVLIGATRHPEQLEWARTIESDYAAIRAEEIEALAKQYLDNRQAATLIFSPAP
jgi:zinc protease